MYNVIECHESKGLCKSLLIRCECAGGETVTELCLKVGRGEKHAE